MRLDEESELSTVISFFATCQTCADEGWNVLQIHLSYNVLMRGVMQRVQIIMRSNLCTGGVKHATIVFTVNAK